MTKPRYRIQLPREWYIRAIAVNIEAYKTGVTAYLPK